MSKAKILYVSQEITPFLPKSEISEMSLNLPKKIKDLDKEVRVFMPRYGKINERRHQLHEVIRLSGINLIINDTDHPLIIKVASVPKERMQVYFIDNEEYFKRKHYLQDENEQFFPDSDERAMFFARGVLETVKKLQWKPDVIHCHGWMASLMPLYLKELYHDDPHFEDVQVVFSAYENGFDGSLSPDLGKKLVLDGIAEDKVTDFKDNTHETLTINAIKNSDAVVMGSEKLSSEVTDFIASSEIESLEYQDPENFVEAYNEFYNGILEKKSELLEQ